MVDQEYELKKCSRWAILALGLRSILRMRVLVREIREKRKLYCCLFPSDYEFERDTLVHLWMAVGLLRRYVHMEDIGNSYFDDLVNDDCILHSRTDIVTGKSKYKVNIDKVAPLTKARQTDKDGCLYATTILEDGNPAIDIWMSSNHIDGSTFEKLKKFSGLRTLSICDYGSSVKEVPFALFLALTSLQVLNLSGTHITELPSSIGNMRQLHYLDLSFIPIKRLPDYIDCLQELQTLKLNGCKHLFALPTGVNKLIKLRHLDFDVFQLNSMPRGIGALTELQTLPAFIVNKEGCNIIELGNMNYLSGSCCISGLENVGSGDARKAQLWSKKRLTELQLRWSGYNLYRTMDQEEAFKTIVNLSPHDNLERLQIIRYPGSNLPTWIQYLDRLVSMTLLECQIREIDIFLGRLKALKDLEIIRLNEVTTIDDHRFRGGDIDFAAFPKLEKLELSGMSSLKTWVGVGSGDFPLLSKLSIDHCPKLTALPFLHCLRFLKNLELSYCTMLEALPDGSLSKSLETVIIYCCPLLKKRCSKGGDDWHKIQHVPNIWIDDADSTSDDDSDYSESEDSV